MALEDATYISGLNSANPTASDPVRQGDDHIRMIKAVLKATFPNLNGAVRATPAEMNKLDGLRATTAELNQLDGLTATTTELNKLDGLKATTAELNKLDGLKATTAELNHVQGVTSNIQTQLNNKSNTGHSHSISDVNGLADALEASDAGLAWYKGEEAPLLRDASVEDGSIRPGIYRWESYNGSTGGPPGASVGTIIHSRRGPTTGEVQIFIESPYDPDRQGVIWSRGRHQAGWSDWKRGFSGNQSWHDVTANRSLGTIYQNTRGYPIMVAAITDGPEADRWQVSDNQNSWVDVGLVTTASDRQSVTFIVPANHYYRANVIYGNRKLESWSELF